MNKKNNIKKGYKLSKLGVIPIEWEVCTFNDIADKSIKWGITGGPFGSDLKSEHYTKDGVRIIQLQNIGDGNFNNNYKIFTSEAKANKLIACNIFPGEIILSKMGDPVTRACVIPNNHERYVMGSDGIRLVPNELIFDKYFVLAYINYSIFRNKAIRHSTGSTRQRIGLSVLKKLPFVLPPLPEQQKIAQILSTWDNAIDKQTLLIQVKELQKKALMQLLLTGKKRFKGFDEKWKFIKLKDILDYKQPTPYIVSSTDYDSKYTTPVLTAGKTFILGYTNEKLGVYKENLPVIIFDDFTTANKYVDFPFKVKSSAMKILISKDKTIDIKLIFEIMQLINFVHEDHKRYWISEFQELEIKLPSNKKEQQKIAQVLTTADNEIENLKKQLHQLQQQKQGLMQVLLTGKVKAKI